MLIHNKNIHKLECKSLFLYKRRIQKPPFFVRLCPVPSEQSMRWRYSGNFGSIFAIFCPEAYCSIPFLDRFEQDTWSILETKMALNHARNLALMSVSGTNKILGSWVLYFMCLYSVPASVDIGMHYSKCSNWSATLWDPGKLARLVMGNTTFDSTKENCFLMATLFGLQGHGNRMTFKTNMEM